MTSRGPTVRIPARASLHGHPHALFEVTDDDGWMPVGGDARDDFAVHLPFPAVVRGRDASDGEFEEETTVGSLSPRRMSLALTRPVVAGEGMLVVVRVSLSRDDQVPALRLALEGTITRTEWLGESRWRVEIQLKSHRFIYASEDDQAQSETGDKHDG